MTFNVSAPKSIPHHIEPQNEPVTKQAFLATTDFTKETAKIIFSPSHSLFIQGIKAICAKETGYMSGISGAFGILMVLASPVYGILKFGIGIPVLIGSAVASGGTSVALGTEVAVRKVYQASKADLQREDLTRQFIKRMHATIDKLPYNQQIFFKQHCDQLVKISAIAVAFNSRNLQGKTLKVGEETLGQEDISNLNNDCKEYFRLVVEIKLVIQSLNLSQDAPHAWDHLMKSFIELETMDAKDDLADRNQVETLKYALSYADLLKDRLVQDPIFQRILQEELV